MSRPKNARAVGDRPGGARVATGVRARPRDAYGDSVATEFYKFGNRYKLNSTGLNTAGLVRFDPQYLPTATDIERLKAAAPQAVLIAAPAPTAACGQHGPRTQGAGPEEHTPSAGLAYCRRR